MAGVITGSIEGEFTDELKRSYAKTLARLLVAEYGKEFCQNVLEELIKDRDENK